MMEIEHLSVRIDESPLNQLLAQRLPEGLSVKELKILLEDSCIGLEGKYAASLFSIKFRVEFQPRIEDGKLRVDITNLKISGMPAALFRNMLMEMIAEQTSDIPGFSMVDQSLFFDPKQLLKKENIPLQGSLQKVELGKGYMRLQAGR